MINRPDLVIFDCDGVLVDSEVIFNQVLSTDLSERGLDLNLQQTMALFVGGSMESVEAKVRGRGVELGDDWIQSIYSKVLSRLEEGVDPVAGIPELLAHLTDVNMPFCVASNGPIHKMQLTLGQNDLLKYFERGLFSAYEVNSWKPEPDLFLHAAKQFNGKPQNCLVIEDSGTGTLAAKNAGMPCLGYAPEGPDERLEVNGAKCFSKMNEVVELLGL